ncbi:MAG TPA: tetratricopeptide repeat protein [Candidatus Udaeobacter sp.]|jgi:serine/threonine protein kinase/tetratricopeptide (TPR) repeat protein|nr:tetratricopeptide repeat protein [Candidatus Udaeobacter sp.]
MQSARWHRITDIYHAAIERRPEERASYLGEACADDEGLRNEVEAMIRSHESSDDFIESPAFAAMPELLVDDPGGALVGQLLGHYYVQSLLGVGGMGEVYLARDERLGRKVALKILPDRLNADEMQLSRFEHEARTASALNHPNILTVYEVGSDGNRHFIAAEFIEGITLRSAMTRSRMSLRNVIEVAVQVGSALAAAHESGVLHRDIKPENVMLRPDGYVKVLDFGIAKLMENQQPIALAETRQGRHLQTQKGQVLGTPHYMSPEQARGQLVDARTDIWSFGVVLYEMIAGSAPFEGETPSDCIASVLKMEPPSLAHVLPKVPAKLQRIVQKALRKNSDERYQTIKETLADLRNLQEEIRKGGSTRTRTAAQASSSRVKRHKGQRKGMPEANVRRLRDELTRFRRGVKHWAVGAGTLLLISIGVIAWQLRELPQLNAMMREGVLKYPQTDSHVRASQAESNPVALQQEIYSKLGEELHVDPKILREKLPQFAEELRSAPNASSYEQASANYVAKDYPEAERLAIEAAREAQTTQPTNTKTIVKRLELAGLSAQRAIQYSRAMQHFQEAEKLTDQKADLKEWVTVQHDLADLLVAWGKYSEAEKRLRGVIEVRTVVLGPEHPDTLDSRHRLIYPLTRQSKSREAETEARQVLALREKILGSENIDTIISRYNLAETLADQRKDSEAEALYRAIIPSAEKLLGPEHPRTLAARLGLATVLTDQGKNIEAESLYHDVIKLDEKVYGPEHPYTLNDRQNLATTLHEAGKHTAAEAEYRDVIKLETKVVGPEHPDLLILRNNLAELLNDEQKFVEAEAQCRRLIPIEHKVLGPENRLTLNTRGNLAIALIGQSKLSEAEAECIDVLNLMERVFGLNHPETRDFTIKFAKALSQQNRTGKAMEIARWAEEHARKSLGPEDAFTQAYAKLVQELQGPD